MGNLEIYVFIFSVSRNFVTIFILIDTKVINVIVDVRVIH